MSKPSHQQRLAVKKTPAPYGHACASCVRAKCRCIIPPSGSCERCDRLGKECQPSQKVRKRNTDSTQSRLSAVEYKLDSLISALQEGNVLQSTTPPPNQASGHCEPTCSKLEHSPPVQPHATYASSLEEASEDEILNRFRNVNLRYLPFIYLPSSITPRQLAQEKPFLWECIKTIYRPDLTGREAAFATLRDTIHRKLLTEGQPNLDLLLGMMAFMSWKTFSHKPFLNIYNHLLIGAVSELELNKADAKEQVPIRMFHRAAELGGEPGRTISFEERRAVLGCFLITSSIVSMLEKGDPLRWTPWMDENLDFFIKAKECPGDELLAILVKIQLVVSKVYMFRRDKNHEASFAVRFWQSQLESVKSQIPQGCQEDNVVQIYLRNAELSIQELSFHAFGEPELPEVDGFKALDSAAQATKSLLDSWIRLPPEDYIGASIISFFQFNRGLMDLLRLSTLEHPRWAKSHVQGIADIRHYIDVVVVNFQAASKQLSQIPDENMFEQTARLFVSLKHKWEPLLGSSEHTSSGDDSSAPMAVDEVCNLDSWMLEGFDNDWMAEFLRLH